MATIGIMTADEILLTFLTNVNELMTGLKKKKKTLMLQTALFAIIAIYFRAVGLYSQSFVRKVRELTMLRNKKPIFE